MIRKYLTLLLMLLVVLGFTNRTYAETFTKDQEYIEHPTAKSEAPTVYEFFSFYCHACYAFSFDYKFEEKFRKILPPNTKLIKYHMPFLGKFGKEITEAWAVANTLNITDQLYTDLFLAAYKNDTIRSYDDIKAIFNKHGISNQMFDDALNSIKTKLFIEEQAKAAKLFNINSTPTYIINNKYELHNEGIYKSDMSDDQFINKAVEVIKFLITK